LEAVDLVVIFALLNYMGKGNVQKNKSNTDHNPTNNPNAKPTTDKLQSERN